MVRDAVDLCGRDWPQVSDRRGTPIARLCGQSRPCGYAVPLTLTTGSGQGRKNQMGADSIAGTGRSNQLSELLRVVCLLPDLPYNGREKEDYRRTSGIPLIGTLFVAVSMFEFRQQPWFIPLAIVLILLDTTGPLWLAGDLIYQHFVNESR